MHAASSVCVCVHVVSSTAWVPGLDLKLEGVAGLNLEKAATFKVSSQLAKLCQH